VNDSAATLKLCGGNAGDFAYQCTHQQEELDFDLPYLHLALEIWREFPSGPVFTPAALDDSSPSNCVSGNPTRFALKLEHLAADRGPLSFLYRTLPELVRNRLFAEPPQTDPAAIALTTWYSTPIPRGTPSRSLVHRAASLVHMETAANRAGGHRKGGHLVGDG